MSQTIYHGRAMKKLYRGRTEMEKALVVSCLFSMLLLVVRIVITGKISFIFLPWNLFLAFIPYYISTRLQRKPVPKEQRVKSIIVFTAWLLFIPNSFYILTDLFHLQIKEEPLRWFDLTLIFSFAWNGLLLGILSVRQMEKIMWTRFRVRNEFFFLCPLMWLIALGIYIGRYMRFNSWDVITNPFQLVEDISYMMIHPFMHFYEWGMITCFSVFMTIIYMSVKRMAKAL
jgi:uncharacterized membrane protein